MISTKYPWMPRCPWKQNLCGLVMLPISWVEVGGTAEFFDVLNWAKIHLKKKSRLIFHILEPLLEAKYLCKFWYCFWGFSCCHGGAKYRYNLAHNGDWFQWKRKELHLCPLRMSKTRLLILKDSEKFIVKIFLSRDSLEVFGNMDAKEKRDVFDVFF